MRSGGALVYLLLKLNSLADAENLIYLFFTFLKERESSLGVISSDCLTDLSLVVSFNPNSHPLYTTFYP